MCIRDRSETETLPRIDHYWLGQSLLDAPLLDRSSYRGRLLHHWRLPQ